MILYVLLQAVLKVTDISMASRGIRSRDPSATAIEDRVVDGVG